MFVIAHENEYIGPFRTFALAKKFRNETWPEIQLLPPILQLLDPAYCRASGHFTQTPSKPISEKTGSTEPSQQNSTNSKVK